jgi:hypothetical protein
MHRETEPDGTTQQTPYSPGDEAGWEDDDGAGVALVRQVPMGIVFARIVIVTAMSFSAALAIFLAVGALWLIALVCVGATLLFMFLMFFVERFAESGHDGSS